ncbi:hypothetical protein F5Y01DRAFT_319348 [Xylaria sp. FL0043]|nr:hypothetical protein F5Y01DRAFT_319348 [Xylaria sp. FL0043]
MPPPSAEKMLEAFLPFWNDMRQGMRRGQFMKTMEGLHIVLGEILGMPEAHMFSPQFVAYSAFIASARMNVENFDAWTGYHKVNSTWDYGKYTTNVDIYRLRNCLGHDKHKSGELLLDILESNGNIGNREAMATILEPPGLQPASSVVYARDEYGIRIPAFIDIDRDIAPYLAHLRARLAARLHLRKYARILVFDPDYTAFVGDELATVSARANALELRVMFMRGKDWDMCIMAEQTAADIHNHFGHDLSWQKGKQKAKYQ